jgi:large subunit ribosomal protein L4e
MSIQAKVFDTSGNESHTLKLPSIFDMPYRYDVIHKAYVNLLSHSFQRQGRYPMAGEVVSAESRNTGLGIARIARAKGEGFSRAGQAAGVASIRKGRVAHPPESWKNIYKRINDKEKLLALWSAIAATGRKDLIERRGHKVPKISSFPLIVSDAIESISKTKDLLKVLKALGLGEDLDRVERSRKMRSGTARRRGRSVRSAVSAIIVIGSKSSADKRGGDGVREDGEANIDDSKRNNKNQSIVLNLTRSIPGVDVKRLKDLSVLDLAPGSKPIRLTIFSETAIKELNNMKKPARQKVMEMTIQSK